MDWVKMEEELVRDEGLLQRPYRCSAGHLTIGVGHKILPEDGPLDEITLQQVGELLAHDISIAIVDLSGIFPTWHKWSESRQHALTNMMFNLGAPRFKKFVKMIAAIEKSDWELAGVEAKDSRWYRQVGDRADRIISQLLAGD